MFKKTFKIVLVLSLAVSAHIEAKKKCNSKECNSLCSLVVENCLRVRGNELVTGDLTTLGNLIVGTSTRGDLTVTGAGSFGGPVSIGDCTLTCTSAGLMITTPFGNVTPVGLAGGGIIPFSSGPIANATVIMGTPTVMGFGANHQTTPSSSPVQYGQFAFTVPAAGTLSNLEGSVDTHFAPNTAQVAWTYKFTIFRSPCTGGIQNPTTPYTATGLVVSATLPATSTTTFPTGQYVSSCGLATGPITVAAGDRIVLVLTSNQPGTPPAINEIGFSASVTYLPS